jgi:hypothetical protein
MNETVTTIINKRKETICIQPIDNDMRILVDGLNILNDFKRLGFNTRGSFVGVVQDNLEMFKDYRNLKVLFQFWAGRAKDEDLNTQLNQLLNQLKNE